MRAMQEILGWNGLLEKGMATRSSILAWRIPWTEEPVGPQSMGHKELDVTERLTLFSISAFLFGGQVLLRWSLLLDTGFP